MSSPEDETLIGHKPAKLETMASDCTFLCTHECKREVRKNQNLGFEQVGPTSKACELCFNGKLVLQEVNAKPQSIDCLIDHSMETDQATEKRKQLMGLIYFNQISLHYARRPDDLDAFSGLLKKYSQGKLTETQLYVLVISLFTATQSEHLIDGFHSFLPPHWHDVDLAWLQESVREALVDPGRWNHLLDMLNLSKELEEGTGS